MLKQRRFLFLKQKLIVAFVVISLFCHFKLPFKKGLRSSHISAVIKLARPFGHQSF